MIRTCTICGKSDDGPRHINIDMQTGTETEAHPECFGAETKDS